MAELAHRGFIFDCDGTLMDTIDAWHRAEDALMEEAGITLTKEERDQLNTLTLEEAGEFFHRNFDVLESPRQVTDLVIGHLLDYYRNEAELKPGVSDFLNHLAVVGAPLAVLSSSPQVFLQAGLRRTGIMDAFQEVVSVDDVPGTKRDGSTYRDLCARLGTHPGDTWFFDDSWYALKAAHEAGLHTVGVHSSDNCGTYEELGGFAPLVVDDFAGLSVQDLLGATDCNFE